MGKQTRLRLLSCRPPSPFHPWTPPQNPEAISWWLWQFHHQKSGRSSVFCLSLHSGFLIPASPSRRVCFLSVNSSPGLSLLLQFSLWCLKERKLKKSLRPRWLWGPYSHMWGSAHTSHPHISLSSFPPVSFKICRKNQTSSTSSIRPVWHIEDIRSFIYEGNL